MSASTGTADDKDGNDKADALVDNKEKNMERSAQLLVGPDGTPGLVIYDTSRGGMQPGEPENHQLWLTGDTRPIARVVRGNVTSGAEFAFRPGGAILPRLQDYLSFFRRLRILGASAAGNGPGHPPSQIQARVLP
jgi:hypothetical protein